MVLQLLRWGKPQVIVEIGGHRGDMTANLCHYSDAAAQVYSVDVCREMEVAVHAAQAHEVLSKAEVWANVDAFGDGGKARLILCDSMVWDWMSIPAPDFAFIDGNHERAHVLRDTMQALRRTRRGGIVVWHDYKEGVGKSKICRVGESSICRCDVRGVLDELNEATWHVQHTDVAFHVKPK